MKTFCILGAGAYGSYLANGLAEKHPSARIMLFDVGSSRTENEEEAGFSSSVINGRYRGATDGRFFGLGGTSAKWGGQLLFFNQNDFADCPEMEEVVASNIRYRERVLRRFFKTLPSLEDRPVVNKKLIVRKGLWLKFSNRNLFHFFKIGEKPNVEVITNHRLIRLEADHNRISRAVLLNEKQERIAIEADRFYLACGALESMRVLDASGLINLKECSRSFSDHVSMRCFKVFGANPIIAGHDFRFKFYHGSLVTTRFIGELDNTSFYAMPIYNEHFTFFQFLKQLIFKNTFSVKQLALALKQAFHLIPFAFHYFARKQLYVFPPWYINIDIELDSSANFIQRGPQKDAHGQQGLEISFQVPPKTLEKLAQARQMIKELLIESGLQFEELGEQANFEKLEDIYHPYNLYGGMEVQNIEELFHPLQNLFVVHTGLLKRSGGINPTAALFCYIEKHLEEGVRSSERWFPVIPRTLNTEL